MTYDYLIVGAGLFGAVFAREMTDCGKRVLVIDKRDHIAGNAYCENIEGINVHKYGAHIFHTNNDEVWEYVNKFAKFNDYINMPEAMYKGKKYNLPFNMNTFHQLWGVNTPEEAKAKIDEQIKDLNIGEPKNLEEQALKLVGKDVYETLIKGYTEKQWGRKCKDLPAFIITRLPLRFEYNNNYFNAKYQGIPIGGYTKMVENMLSKIEVKLNTDFFKFITNTQDVFNKVIFTGKIDEFFEYKYGKLEYRTVKFENETLNIEDFQGNAVVNYTEYEIPYTRIIEHKHFEFTKAPKTIISKEYPVEYKDGMEAFYPINDEKNTNLYQKYYKLAQKQDKIIFGGRLGEYKYYDMDKTIEKALEQVKKEKSTF
ncbi:MAG: UDP-galactopyranose mutase [Clostridia bacterium]|nr:UDP-galactopyranose mutase [Clostridia bacterium]